jgi:hypothetical protein
MPIQKETGLRLQKFGYHFETIPRETVEQIKDPVALAYWIYLLTRPSDWVVRRTHLMERFQTKKTAHDRAMRDLRAAGVVWTQYERDAQGRVTDTVIMVGAIPVDDLPTQSPDVQLADIRSQPIIGSVDHLKKDIVPTEGQIGIRGWDDWVEFRKEIRKKLTPASIRKQVELLENYPPAEQQAVINQSIQNGWTGLFPLKGNGNGRSKETTGHQDTRRLSAGDRTRLARERAYARAAARASDMGCVGDNEGQVR